MSDDTSSFELVILGVGGAVLGVIGSVWIGAIVATVLHGHPSIVPVSVAADAAASLPGHLTDPAAAWPPRYRSDLPGPVIYWVATITAGGAAITFIGIVLKIATRKSVGTRKRTPLGVDARPRFATRRDLKPLHPTEDMVGRFIIGRYRRTTLATEPTSHSGRRVRRISGGTGAVALIGPSRSGKTTAAITGILQWHGPAVLSSVKADLLDATRDPRLDHGDLRIFDPTSTTVAFENCARWSPIRQADTILGAQRAARTLCDAAPTGGVEGIDFWLAQAEVLLSGLLYVAHHSGHDMSHVCDWVLGQDRPSEAPGNVRSALNKLLTHRAPQVQAEAREVQKALQAVWGLEERTRSSVYSTTQTVIWPWADPGVAASSRPGSADQRIDLPWLISGNHTVYLCAPIEDQRRLAPAFGGLLSDLINQAYRHVARTGRPIDPPLLIVIDEAGNTPLRSLPEYASTLAGIGVLLVTIWQSLAQIEAAYGPQADTILTNHRTKCFYAGLSDPASLRYVNDVLGSAEVEVRSQSHGSRWGPGSEQASTTHLVLAPPHALRQMRPGDALMVHGTLPPAHIRTLPYYRQREMDAGRFAPRLKLAHLIPTKGKDRLFRTVRTR